MVSANTIRLSGHGLVLREWGDDDLGAMVQVFDDPDVAYWTPLASPFDLAAAQDYLSRIRRTSAERLHLAITTDGRLPKGEIILNLMTHTIGYGVGAAHRGQRLAYRSALLMTQYAHETAGFSRVILEIEAENVASVGVAKAVGYRLSDAPPAELEEKGRPVRLLTWVHDA